MNRRRDVKVWWVVLLVGGSSCGLDFSGSGSSSGGPLKCEYEESKTGCSGSGFGAYEAKCLDLADPRDDLTPSGWCSIVTSDTSECAGSCCVSYRFRNAVGSRGLCP